MTKKILLVGVGHERLKSAVASILIENMDMKNVVIVSAEEAKKVSETNQELSLTPIKYENHYQDIQKINESFQVLKQVPKSGQELRRERRAQKRKNKK